MSLILFWVFSALMLGFAACVVLLRNPISSAMSLVMSFVSLAALFMTLDAYFIGIIQILVYAGAVMVLFLFIIMLLDLKSEISRRINFTSLVVGFVVVGGFIVVLTQVLAAQPLFSLPFPPLAVSGESDVSQVGLALFTRYNLPLQIVGVLLLVATIGVVVLSKKELK